MSKPDPLPASVEEMLKTRLAQILNRCEQATTGPWDVVQHNHAQGELWLSVNQCADAQGMREWLAEIKYRTADEDRQRADAEFIAHAREDIPFLVSALLASETQQQRMRIAIEKLIASGYLPETCAHGEEPDYCDGCRLQMEKAQQMARIHARAVLALEDLPLPSPPETQP